MNSLPSNPFFAGMNSNNITTGSTVQNPGNSGKIISSSEISLTSTVTVERPLLSPKPVAPANSPDITPRHNRISDLSDIDPSPFPFAPPPLTKTVDRKSQLFEDQKSVDITFFDKPTTSALQNKVDEPSILQIHFI